ncbi:hypothetical protein AB3N02_22630 [Priestia aryabhattai]|uniref:hypothetical protein n=1 Tax=Priestia aryabhattai TaxID=412384 RepID=UPI0039A0A0E2
MDKEHLPFVREGKFEAKGKGLSEKVKTEFNQRAFNIKRWEKLKVPVAGGWDWSPVFQTAIKYIMERGGGALLLPDEDYTCYPDVYTHPSDLNPSFKNSPLTIKGTTPVNADLYNTVKKVPRLIKKQTGSLLGVNYNETTDAVITGTGVYRNLTLKNLAFFGGGTLDTIKYTKVFNSTSNVIGIEKHNSAINIEDCNFWAMKWGIYDPETVLSYDNYCDQSTYKRLGFSNMGTGWIQSIRPDASNFEAIYGYDMAKSCQYGIRARKGESFEINKVLCAGKAMHLCPNFKLISLEYCNSVAVRDTYVERVEGLAFYLDNCKNITIDGVGVRHYGKTIAKGVSNRNITIKNVYSHIEEGKVLSASDTGNYATYDTITTPYDFDFDSTNTDIRYENTFFRNGIHQADGNFTETTARMSPKLNTVSKAVYQVGKQYVFDVVHDGTNFVISTGAGQVSFGTLFASGNPTFNTGTGVLTFPVDGALANISVAHVSGRQAGNGKINQAFKLTTNPLTIKLYDNTMALITTASDVAISVTLHT